MRCELNHTELAAVLAGLRMVQRYLDALPAEIQDILDAAENLVTAEQIDDLCERLNMPETSIWEVTAAGFDADSDETADRVYCVRAKCRKDVANALSFTGARLRHKLGVNVAPDFDLMQPGQAQLLGTALLEWASVERNKDR